MIILITLLAIYIISIFLCRREMIITDMNYSFNTLTNGAMIVCFVPFLNTIYATMTFFDRKQMEIADFKLTKKFFKK